MNRCIATLCRLLLAATCAAPLAAGATVIYNVPYGGQGNLSVFDPVAGTGGWVGEIDETPPTIDGDLPPLVSVVTFAFAPGSTTQLIGNFEFDIAADLSSTLFGTLQADLFDLGFFNTGGQLGITYNILGGTGAFLDASGFGLAYLTYDPAGVFNNYSEIGLLSFNVPEPGTLALAALGLIGARLSRRRMRPLN